jgi:regulator of protease activity HflC (stomatin/prohibitin superfamily)
MIFFLKLAVGSLVSSFFILMQAQAGIVELVNKQFKDLSIKLSATF